MKRREQVPVNMLEMWENQTSNLNLYLEYERQTRAGNFQTARNRRIARGLSPQLMTFENSRDNVEFQRFEQGV